MSRQSLTLSPELHTYLLQVGVREHPAQTALRQQTAQHKFAKMQLAAEQAQLLSWLMRLLKVRNYLELGVFTGYSALTAALNTPEEGKIVACDISREFIEIAEQAWTSAGVRHKIDLRIAPALHSLADLRTQNALFDMILIDADKPNYPEYYEQGLALLRQGGVMILDNMLLNGRVIEALQGETPGINAVRTLNQQIQADDRVEMSLLPVGDGMTLVFKK